MAHPPSRPSAEAVTTAEIDRLLRDPPKDLDSLQQRLSTLHDPLVRQELMRHVLLGDTLGERGELIVHAFAIVGLGPFAEELYAYVSDRRGTMSTRGVIVSLLLRAGGSYPQRLRGVLSSNELVSLLIEPICSHLARVEVDANAAGYIATILELVPAEFLHPFSSQLEKKRQEFAVPAVCLYRELLLRDTLVSVHAQLLKALVQEGGAEAVEMLEDLRARSTDPIRTKQLLAALLRLRTQHMDQATSLPGSVTCHLSSCDGQGAFFLVADRVSSNGQHLIVLICGMAQGGICDAHTMASHGPQKVDHLLETVTRVSRTEFVPLSVQHAQRFLTDCMARNSPSVAPLSPMIERALRFFSRYGMAPYPRFAHAGRTTQVAVRFLMQQPMFATWGPDLWAALDIQRPISPRQRRAAIEAATAAIPQHPAPIARLAAMADHMALWQVLKGEYAVAGLFGEAAASTRRDPLKSALVKVLLTDNALRNSSMSASWSQLQESGEIGDRVRRTVLRQRFFSRVVDRPTGADLALLDLTEAAIVALRDGLDQLVPNRRPAEHDLHEISFLLAGQFAEYLREPNKARLTLIDRSVTLVQQVLRLSHSLSRDLVILVSKGLSSFVEEVCRHCSVNCLGRPHLDHKVAFRSRNHPAHSLGGRSSLRPTRVLSQSL